MKNFFVSICLFAALIFVVSCGGGNSKESDQTDTGETVTDENTADTDQTDTEPTGDTEPDNPDSDDPDTTPEPAPDDDADTTAGPKPDDDADTAPEPTPDEDVDTDSTLSECSSISSTPCRDSSSGLTWSARASSTYKWTNAVDYCRNYTESGLSGWHLPTIDELKTLLIWSKANSCKVSATNNCLAWNGCWTCVTCTEQGTGASSSGGCSDWGTSYSDGRYSKFGETEYFWSSSIRSDSSEHAWGVSFSYGVVDYSSPLSYGRSVRCVRNAD